MDVNSEVLDRSDKGDDVKGKAVIVLHTWKDHLWDMGKKGDLPGPRTTEVPKGENSTDAPTTSNAEDKSDEAVPGPSVNNARQTKTPNDSSERSTPTMATLTPDGWYLSSCHDGILCAATHACSLDVSHCLRNALLQAIQVTLSTLPLSSFPIPASTFWSTYILPARPAYALGTNGLAGTLFRVSWTRKATDTKYPRRQWNGDQTVNSQISQELPQSEC